MTVQGILLDLEGVLYVSGAPVVGAAETVRILTERGYEIRGLTNTTTKPRRRISEFLAGMGIDLPPDRIVSPATAAAIVFAELGFRRLHLAADPSLAEDFEQFDLVDDTPDAVVLGDLHKDFTWDRIDGLLRMLLGGARLVALHRNRVCRRDKGISLDLGPFVAALEYAAGTEAVVVGKPTLDFFELALAHLGVPAENALMVGDDIEADIGGALAAGIDAYQVRTGKYTERDDAHPLIKPSARLVSVAELPEKLEN